MAERLFFCAESIAKRPAQHAKPVMSSVPAHLQTSAERTPRRTVALDVEPASMLTLLEWTAGPERLLGP